MYRLLFLFAFLVSSTSSLAQGSFCTFEGGYATLPPGGIQGPGCLATATQMQKDAWCDRFSSFCPPQWSTTDTFEQWNAYGYTTIRQQTLINGGTNGGFTVYESTCNAGYAPNASRTGCVVNATCTAGTVFNWQTGTCGVPPPPPNPCETQAGQSFAKEASISAGGPEGDGCVSGCSVDWIATSFSFGDNKVWAGTFTGQQCTASGDNPWELPPLLDLSEPENCLTNANGDELCFNQSDFDNQCGTFNDVPVCASDVLAGTCAYKNGKYICGTGNGSPLTTQMPNDENGQDRFPDAIIEGDTNNTTNNNTWIWDTKNWTSGTNPSNTADVGEQLKLDGIAKEGTLQGLKGVIEGIRDNPGPTLQQPDALLEQWGTTFDSSDQIEQLEDSFAWGPFQDIVDGVQTISPGTSIDGLSASSCQSLTFGFDQHSITFPGPDGCERLQWLKLGLAWLFAIFTIIKLYELALGGTK